MCRLAVFTSQFIRLWPNQNKAFASCLCSLMMWATGIGCPLSLNCKARRGLLTLERVEQPYNGARNSVISIWHLQCSWKASLDRIPCKSRGREMKTQKAPPSAPFHSTPSFRSTTLAISSEVPKCLSPVESSSCTLAIAMDTRV